MIAPRLAFFLDFTLGHIRAFSLISTFSSVRIFPPRVWFSVNLPLFNRRSLFHRASVAGVIGASRRRQARGGNGFQSLAGFKESLHAAWAAAHCQRLRNLYSS